MVRVKLYLDISFAIIFTSKKQNKTKRFDFPEWTNFSVPWCYQVVFVDFTLVHVIWFWAIFMPVQILIFHLKSTFLTNRRAYEQFFRKKKYSQLALIPLLMFINNVNFAIIYNLSNYWKINMCKLRHNTLMPWNFHGSSMWRFGTKVPIGRSRYIWSYQLFDQV